MSDGYCDVCGRPDGAGHEPKCLSIPVNMTQDQIDAWDEKEEQLSHKPRTSEPQNAGFAKSWRNPLSQGDTKE